MYVYSRCICRTDAKRAKQAAGELGALSFTHKTYYNLHIRHAKIYA